MQKFPKQFIFGAATAAYQAEGATQTGGKGKTYWDDYLKEQGTFNPNTASDFYHKYEEDLKQAHAFGINGIRISIAWTRIFPEGTGKISQSGVDYYHKLIDACLENGVEPFVTLHHFDTPYPLYKQGDWLAQEMLDAFVAFAEFCFEEYGGKVSYWITINEPWSVVAGQYIIGHFPPNIQYDIPKAVQSMHNMMVAHARIVKTFKENKYAGEIGIVHILESKYPITDTPENRDAAEREHILANRFLLDATFMGRYSADVMCVIQDILEQNNGKLETRPEEFELLAYAAEKIDFLGINYYASHFLKAYEGESQIHHNGTGEKGSSIFALKGIGERVNNVEIPTTDWDWPIYPQGLLDMLLNVKETYPNYKKIYVTENGMGDKDILVNGTVQDVGRIDYVRQHLEAILDAVERGVNVQGYFIWSLMDVFSWTNGYNKRYGLFYVDFETQQRYPKKSAYWYKEIADKKELI
ncbi:6-phospho-beta-galactosidase [Enterococcus sp. CWB-B31]|uniref:6-phospho-beta-galactosidase n=1 Tax=Enterococcus sp. CWB-B31 TaxID=2885159 RepID=UPI001E2A67D4|nr:6-phospho-beta-galactosidase [Enterococcus sp. CWB-B31]MCB5954562.1 6-phospho-beta-galactosidase [Enterococcus sp. CWB-B31]